MKLANVEQHFHDRTGENFMPFNEYIRYREITDQTLLYTYKELFKTPAEHDVRPSQAIVHALDQLKETKPESWPGTGISSVRIRSGSFSFTPPMSWSALAG